MASGANSSRVAGLMDQRDEEWRDTLFYWHGKLSWVGGERHVMSWRGTWLSTVSNVAPALHEFTSSFNFFELNFDVDAERARYVAQGRWDLEFFVGLEAAFRGHYLMEPPDGTGYRRAYRDDEHTFRFDARLEPEACAVDGDMVQTDDRPAASAANGGTTTTSAPEITNSVMRAMFPVVARMQSQPPRAAPLGPGPYVVCAARGRNEFGAFVALGHARRARTSSNAVDDGIELTLARRYVRDDDSRHRWPLAELLASVPASARRGTRVAPWEHALPCRLPSDVIAADNRRQAEQAFGDAINPRPPPSNEYEAMMARKRPRD